VAAPTRIYQPAQPLERVADGIVLHTVITCDLAQTLSCDATVVMGGQPSAFYVTPSAMYVWAADVWRDARAMLYRVPLSGGAPTALRVRGQPFDQFSFLEDGGQLNVVLAMPGSSAGPSGPATQVSLLRVRLAELADGSTEAPRSAYSPVTQCGSGAVENRFIDAHLLVSCGLPATDAPDAPLASSLVVRRHDGDGATHVNAPFWIARIDRLGAHAVIAGAPSAAARDLVMSTIDLSGDGSVADTLTLAGTGQRDVRSHAFAFAAEGATDGWLALPVTPAGETGGSIGAGAVAFVRSDGLRLAAGGLLTGEAEPTDDGCVASCVDWYGDARPVFVDGRVFALLGYEVVEGTPGGGRIVERRRVSFAPSAARP
jgi:hypothetical protein